MEPIVIVGAGMAGAAAALKLSTARIVPWVLEARERIGGRDCSRPYAATQDTSLFWKTGALGLGPTKQF